MHRQKVGQGVAGSRAQTGGCIQPDLEMGTLLNKPFAELLRGAIRASVKLSRLLGA